MNYFLAIVAIAAVGAAGGVIAIAYVLQAIGYLAKDDDGG